MRPQPEKGGGEALVEAGHALSPKNLPRAVGDAAVEEASTAAIDRLVEEPRRQHIKGRHGGGEEEAAGEGTDQDVQPAVRWEVLQKR